MNTTQIVLLVASLALSTTPVHGKRKAPGQAEPVIHQGVVYSAPPFLVRDGRIIKGQYVEAHRQGTEEKLWDVRVYATVYRQDLEQDVQDVFITALEIVDGALLVTNERGERFRVDPVTRSVTEPNNGPVQ